jgi:hypothetical protein
MLYFFVIDKKKGGGGVFFSLGCFRREKVEKRYGKFDFIKQNINVKYN